MSTSAYLHIYQHSCIFYPSFLTLHCSAQFLQKNFRLILLFTSSFIIGKAGIEMLDARQPSQSEPRPRESRSTFRQALPTTRSCTSASSRDASYFFGLAVSVYAREYVRAVLCLQPCRLGGGHGLNESLGAIIDAPASRRQNQLWNIHFPFLLSL